MGQINQSAPKYPGELEVKEFDASYTIGGRVTKQGTGEPLGSVLVRIEELAIETTTDANGSYQFRGVPGLRDKTYTLIAEKDGKQTTKNAHVDVHVPDPNNEPEKKDHNFNIEITSKPPRPRGVTPHSPKGDRLMPTYDYPGVYVEDVPPLSRPIAGVSTSTAGFIGVADNNTPMPDQPVGTKTENIDGYTPEVAVATPAKPKTVVFFVDNSKKLKSIHVYDASESRFEYTAESLKTTKASEVGALEDAALSTTRRPVLR